jgi:hypothetical protein
MKRNVHRIIEELSRYFPGGPEENYEIPAETEHLLIEVPER